MSSSGDYSAEGSSDVNDTKVSKTPRKRSLDDGPVRSNGSDCWDQTSSLIPRSSRSTHLLPHLPTISSRSTHLLPHLPTISAPPRSLRRLLPSLLHSCLRSSPRSPRRLLPSLLRPRLPSLIRRSALAYSSPPRAAATSSSLLLRLRDRDGFHRISLLRASSALQHPRVRVPSSSTLVGFSDRRSASRRSHGSRIAREAGVPRPLRRWQMAAPAAAPPQHPRVPGRGVDGEVRDQRAQGRSGGVSAGGQGRLEERLPQ